MVILKPYFDIQPPDNGGGAPPVADPVELTEYTTLSEKTELTDQDKVRLEELKGKFDTVYKDDKGNVLTKEQIDAIKATEAKFNAILAKPEDQRTKEELEFLAANADNGDEKNVYQQVDEATGITYDIDYGDVDPLSPDGILKREEVIRATTAKEFENTIKTKYSRAYQFMLHIKNGGKEEDFFKPENQDFKQLAIKKEDPAGQERVLRIALAAKGNSPAIIDAVVAALKDGQMYETAKSELEALQTVQTQKEAQRVQLEQQRRLKEEQDVTSLSTQIDQALEKGFDGIKIPLAERSKFAEYLDNRIDYNNGQFYVVDRLDPKELNKMLKASYFAFKGGDLKGLVERSAATQNTLKFKSLIKKEIAPKGTGSGKSKLKLGDI